MQVSLDLDPEVLSMASTYADAHGLSLSGAMSQTIRQTEPVANTAAEKPKFIRKHGLLVVAGTGEPITMEMVQEISEDPLV